MKYRAAGCVTWEGLMSCLSVALSSQVQEVEMRRIDAAQNCNGSTQSGNCNALCMQAYTSEQKCLRPHKDYKRQIPKLWLWFELLPS